MARRPLPSITEAQWQSAVDDYELGHRSARQIARDLAVSPATVSRRMKVRGAVKCSRVNESVFDLVAMLDRNARQAIEKEKRESQRNRAIFEANMHTVGHMVAALVRADHQGELNEAAPMIALVGRVVGTRRRPRSRQ